MPDMHCENCGDVIGRLESPYVWNDHCVCSRCHDKLASRAVQPLPTEASQVIDYEPESFIDDPLRSLVLQTQSQPAQPSVTYTQVVIQHPVKKTSGLVLAGGIIMVASLPLMCFGGLGVLVLLVGFILLIVGLCI